MNVPNRLTMGRIVLTPIFMLLMLIEFKYHFAVAMVVFIVASITDLIDGKLARKNHLVTDFGKFLDPLADKMLTTAAYIGFIYTYRNEAVYSLVITLVTFVVLFREFAVSSIRLVSVSSGGKVIAANIWGKLKTVVQMVSLIAALFLNALKEIIKLPETLTTCLEIIVLSLFVISGVLCILSGIIYLFGAKEYINPSK
ncbi:MAG: CDP-diacylglycerol--glycerol-3-phosphate 3-phosphatidyltransferase [Clostridia bacterium]|nr:CDP-diacylglycerol--glycerol-3-phosphate 3-phosphatidyltransferase [Clostridia bacterium]